MGNRPRLVEHLSSEALRQRYRSAKCPIERVHYQMVWQISRGATLAGCAAVVGYSDRWVSKVLSRYNSEGPAGLGDKRRANPGQAPVLSAAQQEALRAALGREPPEGGLWNGPKVAAWIGRAVGRDDIPARRGWVYLKRLGYSLHRPRPAHEDRATPEEQAAFKKKSPRGWWKSRRPTPTNRLRSGPSTSTASG
jgi:transposase